MTSLTDSIAGAFTAGYSADGQLTTLHYPNGMTRSDTLDTNLSPVSRSYTRDSDGAVIYTDSMVNNTLGHVVGQTFPGGSRAISYDRLGRLSSVAETPAAACTTTTYGYDTRTNRVSQAVYNPGAGGACRRASGLGRRR